MSTAAGVPAPPPGASSQPTASPPRYRRVGGTNDEGAEHVGRGSGKDAVAAMAGGGGRRARVLLTAAVAALLLVGGVLFLALRDGGGQGTAPVAAGGALTAEGAVRVATGAAVANPKATLTIYVDYRCPHCQEFEELFGPTLAELSDSGEVAVDYQPISILDRASTTRYSTRAAQASFCVARHDPGAWAGFNTALFANQPTDQGAGLGDDELTALARAAGAGDATAQCVADGEDGDGGAALEASQARAQQQGVSGTPTVLLDGQALELTTPQDLGAAARAAAQ